MCWKQHAGQEPVKRGNVFRGCMRFSNMYIRDDLTYMVSFVPDFPLVSRNPNFTLMERGGR